MTNGRREHVPRLYLDTNHLSDLVRHPERGEGAEVLALIERGEALGGVEMLGQRVELPARNRGTD